ncbi:outer membrane protein OmpK [Kordiimonas pumila]|uniref:Outer membrane protein OmpK n=1 Tax=Kordiimonas pumila TaxID=2161677 RepID=A0ABV7D9M3_9PROT|nr:outer membrane protein OmpK [Kordiimonas pumila]
MSSIRYRLCIITVLWITVTLSSSVRADDKFLLFANNSISLLTGQGFKLPGDKVSTLTLEHASGWAWGDVYGFLDVLEFHSNPNQDSSWYGEVSPRFSLGKLAGLKFGNGLVKDVLVSTTWERGKNGVEALLIGAAVDLNISGFKYFKTNLYAHHKGSFDVGADDMQITISWARPFTVGAQKFLLDGFLDYEFGLGSAVPNLHLVPQVKWDMGATWGAPGRFYLGTEIDIWRNQFGVRDSETMETNQLAASLLLKATF